MATRTLRKSIGGAPPAFQSSPTTPRPKKASTACTECRKRKSRCHGGVPCGPCRQDSKNCFMNEESDGRRRLFSKRKIDSLEKDRALFIRLLEKIRHSDRKDLAETIEIIRGGASLTDLTLHLPDRRPLELLPCETPTTRGEISAGNGHDSTANARQRYLGIQSIIE